MKKRNVRKSEIVIYQAKDGPRLEVRLEKDTVWLDAHLIAGLFNVNRPAIVKHINNIYKTGELDARSTCSILEQVAADGKIRRMNLYNLDMIISVGYRVNSKRATQFRIWATKTLKEHLIRGYTINEKRLAQTREKFRELQGAIDFLQDKAKHELLPGQERQILNLLADYSKTLTLLERYDKQEVSLINKAKGKYILMYKDAKRTIQRVKTELTIKKEASDLFGQESGGKLKAVLGAVYQTFDRKELYPSLEEKAAHLLYFIIKDHPFIDGNKRIGSLLFVFFLDKNNYSYKKNGERKINDNALTALALLIAESDPREKDILIRIITNLLGE